MTNENTLVKRKPKAVDIQTFQTRESAFTAVTLATVSVLRDAIEQNGSASIILSGGRTPAPAYSQIADAPVDWSRVHVGLVDDRWVDEADPASNAGLVRASFLEAGAGAAEFVSMKTNDERPQSAVDVIDAAYQPFASPDVAIIGLGPDGHTASWFPGSNGLEAAMSVSTPRIVEAIDGTGCPVAGDLPLRMTVTLPVLVRANTVILLITGDEKRSVLENTAADLPIHKLFAARSGNVITVWAPS